MIDKIGVYKIQCLTNDKVYIGGTTNIHTRWINHRSVLNRDVHPNKFLQEDYDKYGEGQFIYTILEECLESELEVREQYWIDYLQSHEIKKGYNIFDSSGDLPIGYVLSEQIRLKMSISAKKAQAARTPEERSTNARKHWLTKAPIERGVIARKREAVKTPKERSQAAKDAWATKRLWAEIATVGSKNDK